MGTLVNYTGWMPDQILERLTWRDVSELNAHWRRYPPLYAMAHGYLKVPVPDEIEGEEGDEAPRPDTELFRMPWGEFEEFLKTQKPKMH